MFVQLEFGDQINTVMTGHKVSQQCKASHCLPPLVEFCSCAHCWCFWQWMGVSRGSPQWSETTLSEPVLTSLAASTSSAGLFCSSCASERLGLPSAWRSFLGPLLINNGHCRPGTPHKNCTFGDALNPVV